MTTLTGASLEQLISWVTQAGILALDHQQGDLRAGVSIKADDTIVTIADHKVESFLATQLRTTFPDDSLVAEEGSRYNVRPDGRIWTFDPIDGTKLFYLQLPGWGISLGYLEQGQPAAGFFYMPTIEDLTWGFGSQVYHYHHKNNLDSLPDLKYDSNAQSLIGAVQTRWDEQYGTLATLANFPRRFRTDLSSVRTLGGVTASVVYVAQGKATAALFTHGHLWDIAPAAAILKRAGGEIRYLSGRPIDYLELLDGRLIPEPVIAGHPDVLDELQSHIEEVN